MDNKIIGGFIKSLRSEAGLTQGYVAEQLKVSRPKYSALENGQAELSLSEIKSLADLYEVSPNEIVEAKLTTTYEYINLDDLSDLASPTRAETDFKLNEDECKLMNVLLYIISNVGARPNVGESVLHKLLYFIDFDFYEKNRQSITGLQYYRNHYGPTPNSVFLSTVENMRISGELVIVDTPCFTTGHKKYLPVINADLSCLTAEEIKHIDLELGRLADKSANELAELTRKDMPWLATKPGELIDYQLAMYRTSETSTKALDDDL